jgi:hypothetical protein
MKHNQDVYQHISEPAEYALHCWQDSQICNKQFIFQYESLNGKIQEMKTRREKKRQQEEAQALLAAVDSGINNESAIILTQDVLTQVEEEDEGEKWSRRGPVVELEAKLRNELRLIFENCEGLSKTASAAKRYDNFKTCMGSVKLPSYITFIKFMQGTLQSKKGLKKHHRMILQEFVEKKRLFQPAASDNEV